MGSLLRHSQWEGKTLGFFEEFRELSERSSYLDPGLDQQAVELTNPVCGDLVRVKLSFDRGRVSEFGYQQKGCWPVVGCLELLGRLVGGASLRDIADFRLDEFLALVRGVPASKRHAFSLTHRALLAAAARADQPGPSSWGQNS